MRHDNGAQQRPSTLHPPLGAETRASNNPGPESRTTATKPSLAEHAQACRHPGRNHRQGFSPLNRSRHQPCPTDSSQSGVGIGRDGWSDQWFAMDALIKRTATLTSGKAAGTAKLGGRITQDISATTDGAWLNADGDLFYSLRTMSKHMTAATIRSLIGSSASISLLIESM